MILLTLCHRSFNVTSRFSDVLYQTLTVTCIATPLKKAITTYMLHTGIKEYHISNNWFKGCVLSSQNKMVGYPFGVLFSYYAGTIDRTNNILDCYMTGEIPVS